MGWNIKERRAGLWTQSELADHLGITRQALSQRLLDRVDFRMGEVTAAARFLNTTIAALVGEVAA